MVLFHRVKVIPQPQHGIFFRLSRFIAWIAAIGLSAVFALLFALWLEHLTSVTLPTPSGPFAVGRTTCTWANHALVDELAPAPGAKRQALVWIWYPSSAQRNPPTADYLPAAWRDALSKSTGFVLRHFLVHDASRVHTHSIVDAALSPQQPSYPVVLLRTGNGALTTDYTALAEDLASHGYIVVGFDAPYRTFAVVLPNGEIVKRPPRNNPETLPSPQAEELAENTLLPMWVSDMHFVVDQLTKLNEDRSGIFAGHLDLEHLGVVGHSFGGAQALEFCHEDRRCKAGIDLDGMPFGSVVREGTPQPFLVLLSDHGDLAAPEPRAVMGKIDSVYAHLPRGSLLQMVRGANHFSFSDHVLVNSQIVIGSLRLVHGGVEPRRGIEIENACVHTFFDVHLKNAPAESLDTVRSRYPEIQDLPPGQ